VRRLGGFDLVAIARFGVAPDLGQDELASAEQRVARDRREGGRAACSGAPAPVSRALYVAFIPWQRAEIRRDGGSPVLNRAAVGIV
jgi:hypothetical protein